MRFSTHPLHTKCNSKLRGRNVLHSLVLTLGAVGAMLVASAGAAAVANQSDARARYQEDRAACMSGASHQDRATCLREAGAALQEATRGHLADGDTQQYEQNRLSRCNVQPAEDREDCVRRMHGEGITKGSAEEGGVYRELVRPVVPK